jgi:hypothetical protein
MSALFFASTSMSICNGQKALFWEDRLINGQAIKEIAPHLYTCIPKRRPKAWTVSDGIQWGKGHPRRHS